MEARAEGCGTQAARALGALTLALLAWGCGDETAGSGCTLGGDDCGENATCQIADGEPACVCDPGFYGNGMLCADFDECVLGTHNCHPHATCTNTEGSFTCTCLPGYTGDGITCTDVDECTLGTDDCDPVVTCTNEPGSYTCGPCPSGYQDTNGDGTLCTDIDECTQGLNGCDPLAGCVNQPGGFTCGPCPSGYQDTNGDGTLCTDIDECAAGTDDCGAGALCINLDGSFTCCVLATCAGAGAECGMIPDGCGGAVSCGSCVPPEQCGDGGVPNLCTCTNVTECLDGDGCCPAACAVASDADCAGCITTTFVLDTVGDTGANGSLALAADGSLHVSYIDTTNAALRYATDSTGAWVLSTVVPAGVDGRRTSIAIDAGRRIYISFSAGGALKVVNNASGAWVVEDASAEYVSTGGTSLVLDSTSAVHVAFDNERSNSHKIMLATNQSGAWVTTSLTSYGYSSPSLAIDANDKLHLACLEGTGPYQDPAPPYGYFAALAYLTNASGGWTRVYADAQPTASVGADALIAVDPQGFVHISYLDLTNDDLKYATNASGSWVPAIADSSGYQGRYTSIAADAAGKVHIGYINFGAGDLKYATNVTGAWVRQQVGLDGGRDVGLVVDGRGVAHAIYYNSVNDIHLGYTQFCP